MSATEEHTAKPDEIKPVESVATDSPVVDTTTAPTTTEATPAEMAVLTKDPVVVASNLENAEPVSAEPATSADAAKTEGAPAVPEKHKEGSTLLGFLKKHVPNPKSIEKKSTGKSTAEAAETKKAASETPAKSEIEPVAATSTPAAPAEAAEEKPFEGEYVDFKTHGGFFGGGWKSRMLHFGKEDGHSQAALATYIGVHKVTAFASSVEKSNAAWDNAAHATCTGVGLLFICKSKALDIPLNIINLADVTGVTVHNGHFTIKTEVMGDYEFNAGYPNNAQKWKTEIETRAAQSKLTRSAVQESDKYKESFAYFKEMGVGHKSEAVTSDEEGAVSGEETKRPGKWTRRISGSFQKFTGSSKDTATPKEATTEAPKDASAAPEAVAAEAVAAVEPTSAPAETAPAATESAVADTPADASAEQTKKDKRKSLSGLTGLWKGKGASKEPSPEPTATKEVTEDAPATTETPAPVPTEPTTETEDTQRTTTAPESKSKRQSIFAGLLPKSKDKTTAPTLTNGDAAPATTETTEPAPTTTEAAPTEEAEFKPPTPKKDSLGRRLTSQFKSLGRSKSPEKKSTKVSDEAPKIDTAIGSTTDASPDAAATVETPEVKVENEQPLSTTEAPSASEQTPATTTEPSAPVISTQA